MWAGVITAGIAVLVGLALLLWPPKAGTSWWSWQRLFGAAFIVYTVIVYALALPTGSGPTRGGLILNGIMMAAMGLWYLFAGLWSVNGPDVPAGVQLRQRSALSALFILYGAGLIALGLTIPR